ncbi:hypothetical protein AK812_SmicGene38414 [Symbiodinium microadriaticum]|uniref:Uncharacterized protein n=1 Tax=Symbiodinium microadriaticum TaxID=2951 RepID=A0A1Q9CDT6_SYMMI|nr:hypothetical protein AK812_SmicGene38414 [Symbiodinium microadriaticum]
MAASLPTVPEVQHEDMTGMTGDQRAEELSNLTGKSAHLTGALPEDRADLARLATGESFVRPTAFTRVRPDTASVLVVDADIGNGAPDENGNLAIDAAIAIGIRPVPANAMNGAATASTATGKGIGKNGTPVGALHLMNEALAHNRLSRNGPVSLEVSAALTRMDIGRDVTRIWQRLDEFVTLAGTAECAIFRREWNEDCAPTHRKLRPVPSNGPNDCMVETAWYAMTKAERMFLTKRNWHIERKNLPYAKANVTHDLVNVYDWVMLPASVGEKFCQNGAIDLSKFPCHQLNGSFNALSALRKCMQWFCQDCFEENAGTEGVVFVVRRRTKTEAQLQWVTASNGKQKLDNQFNRQFTDHISTQNGVKDENEVLAGITNVPRKWMWTVPRLSEESMGIIRMPLNDPMMLLTNGRPILCLDDMAEWNRLATVKLAGLIEWRLIGSATVIAQVANALNPGAEVVLRMNANAKGNK